jgi:hypothetical protein
MATYSVYRTVHFYTEVEADSIEQAEQLASVINYENMESYDESDFRVEELDNAED